MSHHDFQKRVIVIGGGISGLSTAFWLKQKGIDVRVLERSSRGGGLIRSEKVDGFLMDHAANCVFNYLPEVNFLCQTLGLNSSQVLRQEVARKRYLVKNGIPTPVPMKMKDFITSDLWSLKGKLRLLLEPFIPRAENPDEETVSQFITRRFGREIFERSIEPYVAGTLSGDAEKSCVRSTFEQFSKMEDKYGSIIKGAIARKLKGVRTSCAAQVFSFRDGMEELPAALISYLGDSFLNNCLVSNLDRVGRQWAVKAERGGVEETFHADSVIIAAPAWAAASMVEPLSYNLSMLLGGIEYSRMASIFFGFDRKDVEHKLDGIGCLVPKVERGFNTLGSLWSSTLFEGRSPHGKVLFTNYMGGMRNRDILNWSDGDMISSSFDDLRRTVGIRNMPVMTRLVRHERALPQYNLGHQMFLERLEEELNLLPGLHITGNFMKGVSVRACISQGRETAHKVDDRLRNIQKRFTLHKNGHVGENNRVSASN